ncbi:MAG: type 4a pilus biogenesis protein PilO [Candidatus Omnitrophica bacterium]|nr:type 4a pilus biogenesis protein PilO [Candidatus Omnitrophota bacterium]
MKKIISKEIQQLLSAGVVVFVVIFLWGSRLMFQNSVVKINQYRKQIKRVKLENEIGAKLEELKKVKESLGAMRESSKFLAEIAKMAGQLNVRLVAISALPAEKRDLFVKMGVSLEVDTTYHELGILVNKFEELKNPVVLVEKVAVAAPSDVKAQTTRITAKMLVSTLYLTDSLLEK